MRGSVARRLAVAMVGTVGVALLLAGAGFISYSAGNMRRELVRHTRIVADLVAANALTALAFDDPEFAREILATVAADENVQSACLYAQAGGAYARFSRDGNTDTARCPEVSEASSLFEDGRLHIHQPVLVGGRQVASVYLDVDTRPVTAQLEKLLAIVALVLAGALVAAFVLSHRVRGAIAGPISELVAHAHQVAAGDLSRLVESRRRDELGHLARAFGSMQRELGQLVRRIRGNTVTVSDAVQSLRTASDEIQKDARDQEQAVTRAVGTLERMGTSIDRVNRGVEGLSVDAEATATSASQLKASAADVSQRLDALFAAIDTTAATTRETSASIASIAANLQALRRSTASTMLAVSSLAEVAETARAAANDNRELSSSTATTARAGVEVVSHAVASITTVDEDFQAMKRAVEDLSTRVESIHTIVEAIDGIASESALLSLNAQIIAAQAGESGKSFSVVAQQMKALAGQTTVSAGEIAELIGGVREAAEVAVTAVSRGSERVRDGVDRTQEAGRAFQGLNQIAERLEEMGSRIDGSTRDLDAGTEQVQEAMAETEQTVAQIDRSITEQQAAASEVARATESMRDLGLSVRSTTGEQASESELIAAAVAGVKQTVDEILAATREQAAESAVINDVLVLLRESADAAGRRAADLEAIVAALSERSRGLEQEIDRFQV